MTLHYQVAQLGFAATYESARGKGAHMALLRRRIVDALAAGSRQLFAVTEEPLECPDGESTAARNLVADLSPRLRFAANLREPRLGTIVKLASSLGVTPESLCTGMRWDEDGQRFRFKR